MGARLWSQFDGRWQPQPLPPDHLFLLHNAAGESPHGACTENTTEAGSKSAPKCELAAATDRVVRGAAIQAMRYDGGERWILWGDAASLVLHNGRRLVLGLVVLRDLDEIMVARAGQLERYYFTTQQLAQVQPAPPHLSAPCPRCKGPIAAATPAVCCPTCGAWHHQQDDRPCFTYSPLCAACHRPGSELGGESMWSPALL